MSHKAKKKLRKQAREIIKSVDENITRESRYKLSDKKVTASEKKIRKAYLKNGHSKADIQHIYIPANYKEQSKTIHLAGCEKALVKQLERQLEKHSQTK